MFSFFTKTEKIKEALSRLIDLIEKLIDKQSELELQISELRARIKDNENFVMNLDEDFISYQKGVHTNLINIAQKCKLKPKDLVTFNKNFVEFAQEVEEKAEKALTKMEE